jgi:hypothetical protein
VYHIQAVHDVVAQGPKARPGRGPLALNASWPSVVELLGVELACQPSDFASELRFRSVAFRFTRARYMLFRSRVLTASRASQQAIADGFVERHIELYDVEGRERAAEPFRTRGKFRLRIAALKAPLTCAVASS